MSLKTRPLLDPRLNFPASVSIVQRTKTLLPSGRTSTTSKTTKSQAIWVDGGWIEKRTQGGTRTAEVAEVHLPTKWNVLEPADDYFIKSGIKYRITSKLDMSRMSGSVMFNVERRDE